MNVAVFIWKNIPARIARGRINLVIKIRKLLFSISSNSNQSEEKAPIDSELQFSATFVPA